MFFTLVHCRFNVQPRSGYGAVRALARTCFPPAPQLLPAVWLWATGRSGRMLLAWSTWCHGLVELQGTSRAGDSLASPPAVLATLGKIACCHGTSPSRSPAPPFPWERPPMEICPALFPAVGTPHVR